MATSSDWADPPSQDPVAWHRDVLAYVGLTTAALALTLVLGPPSTAPAEQLFDAVEPTVVVMVALVAGAVALGWLRSRFGFRVLLGRGTLRGLAVATGLAVAAAAAVLAADVAMRYPEDINVPLPRALAFYPAVGFVAEIAFHVVPLAALLLGLSPARARLGSDRLVWLAIILVAALEPTFQVLFEADPSSPLAVYTWGHVFAISLLQLLVFRRYDFVSMLTLRLVYYACWHVAWGTIRLEVLF